MECPYDRGKLMFLAENLDDKEFLKRLIIETCNQCYLILKSKKSIKKQIKIKTTGEMGGIHFKMY